MTNAVATTTVETIEFPCEDWFVQRTPQGELVSIRPVPGTWTLLSVEDRQRFAEQGRPTKALFACPRCQQIGFVGEDFKPPTVLGDTKPLPELHCIQCHFVCRIIFKGWDQRRLYCAIYETRLPNGSIQSHKDYLHAEDEFEARKYFWAQHPNNDVYTFIGIAPVVGFFLENPKDDKILLVE